MGLLKTIRGANRLKKLATLDRISAISVGFLVLCIPEKRNQTSPTIYNLLVILKVFHRRAVKLSRRSKNPTQARKKNSLSNFPPLPGSDKMCLFMMSTLLVLGIPKLKILLSQGFW